MFKAVLRKEWDVYTDECEIIYEPDIMAILEHIYSYYKNPYYPSSSTFHCKGKNDGIVKCGYVEVTDCLQKRHGYPGAILLEEITYLGENEKDIIIYSKRRNYISPKTEKLFVEFAKIAKDREAQEILGDF